MSESKYLSRHALYPRLIEGGPDDVSIIVVVPSFNEVSIEDLLESLDSSKKIDEVVEVIIVVNESSEVDQYISQVNQSTVNSIHRFRASKNPWFALHVLYMKELPPKHAGVGLARKIGMDEACRRLSAEGVIVCLDADCKVEENYFVAIQSHFTDKKVKASAIHYEHPLSGDLESGCYDAIIEYELHLRYYIDMQRRINLPYAYHTVGSSMAVRKEVYEAVGGMNKRKAGEDFYFIQKLIKHGGFSNCASTTVYPSPRTSDRVPFGTGKAINDLLLTTDTGFLTYPPEAFNLVQSFINDCLTFYASDVVSISNELKSWSLMNSLGERLHEIRTHSTDRASYTKRFYNWFDGFILMKMLHHLKENQYPLIPVIEATTKVNPNLKGRDGRSILEHYRKMDRTDI